MTTGLRSFLLEDEYWQLLAARVGLALPPYGVELGSDAMRRWLHDLRMKEAEYLSWVRDESLEDFLMVDPGCSLREWCGTVLEQMELLGRITRRKPAGELATA